MRMRLMPVLAAAGAVGLLAGCGLASGSKNETPDKAAAGPASAAAPATVPVGKSFWYGGFKVTLGTATLTPAETRATVDIDVTFENLGNDARAFDGEVALTAGGNAYESDTRHLAPTVPPGAKTKGTLGFALPKDAALTDATLTVGVPTEQQAIIPLGTTGTLKTLEPVALTVTGQGKGGDLAVKVSGGELRADNLKFYRQLKSGKLALALTFAVTYAGTNRGGFAFSARNNLFLQLPDSTRVAPEDGPIELLDEGSTEPDLTVYFEVSDPPAGTYALVVRDDRTKKEGTIPFTIQQ